MATLSATGSRKVQAGFSPLVSGFTRVSYDDIDAIKKVAENNSDVVAVLVEPIQGEGGVRIPDTDYLSQIRQICDENNWLMMLDEIQTGMGRTGKWFAFQHSTDTKNDITPDVMTLAKALGNGVPIGACLAAGKAADVFSPGTHGSTFGGNPLATRAALSVLDVMENENLIDNATKMGNYIVEQFRSKLDGVEGITNIRGLGLMIGVELSEPCADLVAKALDKQLLINVTADKVIRLLPPLIITQEQADTIVDTVVALIKDRN
jgi:acetylornithine aminotransferase